MLFFSNPFLISGFGTSGWERVRRQEWGETEKERDKTGIRARQNDWRLPGGRYGVCVYVTHISSTRNE